LMTGTMMFLAQPLLSRVASASPQQPEPKSFENWCRQKKSVPAATRHTIDILLKEAGTKDCKLADRQLKTLTNLRLDFNQIRDVKPLAGLTNLTSLWLLGNQITDVKPLEGLTNLTSLWLGNNPLAEPLPGRIAVKVCPVKPESICRF
jgi:internalin A